MQLQHHFNRKDDVTANKYLDKSCAEQTRMAQLMAASTVQNVKGQNRQTKMAIILIH